MPRRRSFQFRLRTLLLLMTVLCVVVGPRLNRAQRDCETLAMLRRLPYHVLVYYDYHHVGSTGGAYINEPKPGPEWARRLLGDEFFMRIEHVYLRGKEATDADLRCLAPLTRDLHGLTLTGSSVTGAALSYLARFNALRRLDLGHCWGIDDAGTKHLARLSELRYLNLRATQVTDAGTTNLSRLKNLETLDVGATDVTPDGLFALRKALPSCQILWHLGHPFEDDLESRRDAVTNHRTIRPVFSDGGMPQPRSSPRHQKIKRTSKPGPYHETYLQQVVIQERGDGNLDDKVSANFVWASPRQIADQLMFEFEQRSNPVPAVTDKFTTITQKSYSMTTQTIRGGGRINASYTIYSVGYKNENGVMSQKALDEVTVARPYGTGLGILADGDKAQQRDQTNFELFLRAQGTNTTVDNRQMQFFAFNNRTKAWNQFGGNVAVPPNSTVIYTLVTTQSMAAYVANGRVRTKVVIFDITTNMPLGTATPNISVNYSPQRNTANFPRAKRVRQRTKK